MTNNTILAAAAVALLLAYGAKKASASASTPAPTNGPDLLDFEESSRGIKFEHVKTADTSLTAFPIELWSHNSTNPADGTITKTGIAYATDDTSSYVEFTKTAAGKVSVLRKGIGAQTAAIIKQL